MHNLSIKAEQAREKLLKIDELKNHLEMLKKDALVEKKTKNVTVIDLAIKEMKEKEAELVEEFAKLKKLI